MIAMSPWQHQSKRYQGWVRGISYMSFIAIVMVYAVPAWQQGRQAASDRESLLAMQADAQRRRAAIERLEKSDPQRVIALNQLLARTYVSGNDEAIRNQWLETVRKHGGKIRQLEISEVANREWTGAEDSITREFYANDRLDNQRYAGEGGSEYLLHDQTIVIRVVGSLETIHQIMQERFAQRPLSRLQNMTVIPAEGDELQLRLELHLYGLTSRRDEPTDEPIRTASIQLTQLP